MTPSDRVRKLQQESFWLSWYTLCHGVNWCIRFCSVKSLYMYIVGLDVDYHIEVAIVLI